MIYRSSTDYFEVCEVFTGVCAIPILKAETIPEK